jgi:hypothetical protein
MTLEIARIFFRILCDVGEEVTQLVKKETFCAVPTTCIRTELKKISKESPSNVNDFEISFLSFKKSL